MNKYFFGLGSLMCLMPLLCGAIMWKKKARFLPNKTFLGYLDDRSTKVVAMLVPTCFLLVLNLVIVFFNDELWWLAGVIGMFVCQIIYGGTYGF